MYTMNTRERIQDRERKAGKERSLHSPEDGIDLFEQKRKYPGVIHDDSNVLGWNKKI